MKKVAFLFLAALLFWSCDNSPQAMAEKSVKTYLKKNSSSYQAGEFGKLDTIQLSKMEEYTQVRDSLRIYKERMKETADQFKIAENQQNTKRLTAVKKDMDDFYANKKFKINHKYKANAVDGSQQEVDAEFFLDDRYRVVE